MTVELTIPAIGESISEATIAEWLKQVGEPVAAGEIIARLETDKISVDLPAPAAGVLAAQHHPVGAVVSIGTSIGAIAEGAQPAQAPAAQPAPAPAAQPAPAPAQPAPPPAPATQPAPAVQAAPPPAPATQPAPAQPALAVRPPLPPTQRRLLREQGIDPSTVTWGVVPQGGHAAPAVAPAAAPASPAPAPASPAPALAAPAPAADRPEEVKPMSPLRKRIADRLVAAQHTAAILTTFNEVDMTNIQGLRARYQEEFTKKHGIKLGFMSFFARACVEALKAYPGLNAEVRDSSIVYKKYYDIGVAVGGGRGLVVPVVRGVDRMGLAEIERELAALAQKAKEDKLTLADLSGGTFTISNGGIYGSMMSTPLLNMPQTGILGMHNIIRRPVAVGERIEIRPMMYLALSYDHRVVDGREAVQFLVHVKDHLEQPEKLLLGL
jgi:2-oxoglutarate dehydrogenase E2 component (dihydrolipoamide succinyltransferase)